MAKLPTQKRISRESLQKIPKDSEQFVTDLVTQINSFMTTVYDALAGDLAIGDNVIGMVKTFQVVAGVTADLNTFTFTHTLKTMPRACFVGKAELVGASYVPILLPVWCSWHIGEHQIVIDAITGLTSGSTYNITVVIF